MCSTAWACDGARVCAWVCVPKWLRWNAGELETQGFSIFIVPLIRWEGNESHKCRKRQLHTVSALTWRAIKGSLGPKTNLSHWKVVVSLLFFILWIPKSRQLPATGLFFRRCVCISMEKYSGSPPKQHFKQLEGWSFAWLRVWWEVILAFFSVQIHFGGPGAEAIPF